MTGYGITLTVLPYYVDRVHGLSGQSSDKVAFHIGLLTSAYALAQLAASPIAGRLSDRIGRRPLLFGGLAGMAATQALLGVGSSLSTLYVLRVVGGVASSAMLVAATAFVADMTSPHDRSRGMAWFGTSVSLGLVAGPALGGALSRPGFSLGRGAFRLDGYSLPFLAAAALAAAVLVAAMRTLPETRSLGAEQPSPQQPDSIGGSRPTRPGLHQLLGLVMFSQFGLSLFEGTFVLYGRDRLNLTAMQASIAFMVCGLVMAILQVVVTGSLAKIAAPVVQIAAGLGLMGVGIGALTTTTEFTVSLLWITVLATGTALVTPNLSALISLHDPSRSATAMGLKNAAGSLGQFSGPLLGGMLIGWRQTSPFLLSAAFLLVVCVTWTIGAGAMRRR